MMQSQEDKHSPSFSERELHYLMDRSLARLGFVCKDMLAHLMPVLFEFDGAYFYLSGWNLKHSQRFLQTQPEQQVTLLIDDVQDSSHWTLRGIEVTGIPETRLKGDYMYVRIRPLAKTSWGIHSK